MRAVVALYYGPHEEQVVLDVGQLVLIDDTHSVRLVELQP